MGKEAMELELEVQEPGRRDLLWDALMESCGIDVESITSQRGIYNKVLARLRRVRATPEDIRARAVVYRVRFPHAAVTPSALERHWPELKPVKQQRSDAGAYCNQCGELLWMPGTGRMRCRCD